MARISQICLALLAVAFTATSAAPCYDGQNSVATVDSNDPVTPIAQVDAEKDCDNGSDVVDTSVDIDTSVDDDCSDNVDASIDVDTEATTGSAPCVDGDSTDIIDEVSTDDVKDCADHITDVTHGVTSVVTTAAGENEGSLVNVNTGYIGTGPISLDNLAENALSSGDLGDNVYHAQSNHVTSITSVEGGNDGGLIDVTAGYIGTGPISADNALTNLLSSRSNGPIYAQSDDSSDVISTVDVDGGSGGSLVNVDAGYIGTGPISADNLATNLLSSDDSDDGLLSSIL